MEKPPEALYEWLRNHCPGVGAGWEGGVWAFLWTIGHIASAVWTSLVAFSNTCYWFSIITQVWSWPKARRFSRTHLSTLAYALNHFNKKKGGRQERTVSLSRGKETVWGRSWDRKAGFLPAGNGRGWQSTVSTASDLTEVAKCSEQPLSPPHLWIARSMVYGSRCGRCEV